MYNDCDEKIIIGVSQGMPSEKSVEVVSKEVLLASSFFSVVIYGIH